jgi:aspartate-semialdehyde dehydrogenase
MVKILIFGCTGLVGKVLIDLIKARNFSLTQVILVASLKSKGKKIKVKDIEYEVMSANDSLKIIDIDIIFFCSSATLAKKYCPLYLKNNEKCFIIDNSSYYRLNDSVDIIIPPVNRDLLKMGKRIISNSNCTTAGLIMAIYKLNDFGIKRMIITSFQSVSGSGYSGLNQLIREQQDNVIENPEYCKQIHNNVIPLIGTLNSKNITSEEEKLIYETRKILKKKNIKIIATCVRVPIDFCHSLSVNITFSNDISLTDIKERMNSQEGLILINDDIITPIDIKDKHDVFVCRLRKNDCLKNSYSMFITFNNLFRGASLNSIQIAEELLKNYFSN